MPCGTASFLASSKRLSIYCTVWITYPPILKSQNPSRASLVRYSLYYKSSTYFDKQYPCRTPLSVSTLLVFPMSSHTVTRWSIHSLLINLCSYQSISFFLVSALIWSSLHCQKIAYNSSSMSKVYSDIILSIPIAFLVPFPPLNPNWYCPSKSSIFFSILPLSILPTSFDARDEADCSMVTVFCSFWILL